MIRNKFKDPSPNLTGAPSSQQSGIRFKSPSVDSPNLKLSDDINSNKISNEQSTFSPNGFDTMATSGNSSYVDPNTGEVKHTSDPIQPSDINSKNVDTSTQLKSSSKRLNDLRDSPSAPNQKIKYGHRIKTVKLKTTGLNLPTSDQVQESSLNTFK